MGSRFTEASSVEAKHNCSTACFLVVSVRRFPLRRTAHDAAPSDRYHCARSATGQAALLSPQGNRLLLAA